MIYQFGKNPEFTFSICWNAFLHNGHLSFPLGLDWWNYKDAEENRNIDVAIWFLGLRFGFEIWRFKNDTK